MSTKKSNFLSMVSKDQDTTSNKPEIKASSVRIKDRRLREKALFASFKNKARLRLIQSHIHLTPSDVRAAQAARRVMARIDTSQKNLESALRDAFKAEIDEKCP